MACSCYARGSRFSGTVPQRQHLRFRRWNQSPTILLVFSKQRRNIMISKWLAIVFLAAVITGPASAQTTGATTHKEGEWRGSKLVGVDVYNQANEKIGDVNDVILDRSGKVSNVILVAPVIENDGNF
jgi:hypothetical protein